MDTRQCPKRCRGTVNSRGQDKSNERPILAVESALISQLSYKLLTGLYCNSPSHYIKHLIALDRHNGPSPILTGDFFHSIFLQVFLIESLYEWNINIINGVTLLVQEFWLAAFSHLPSREASSVRWDIKYSINIYYSRTCIMHFAKPPGLLDFYSGCQLYSNRFQRQIN